MWLNNNIIKNICSNLEETDTINFARAYVATGRKLNVRAWLNNYQYDYAHYLFEFVVKKYIKAENVEALKYLSKKQKISDKLFMKVSDIGINITGGTSEDSFLMIRSVARAGGEIDDEISFENFGRFVQLHEDIFYGNNKDYIDQIIDESSGCFLTLLLKIAIKVGNTYVIEKLIAKGAILSEDMFLIACKKNNLDLIKKYKFKQGATPFKINSKMNMQACMIAVRKNNTALFQLLATAEIYKLAYHFNRTEMASHGWSANDEFVRACYIGDFESVKNYLHYNRCPDFSHAVRMACYGGHTEIVEFLWKYSKFNPKNFWKEAKKSGNLALAKFFHNLDSSFDFADERLKKNEKSYCIIN